MHRAERCLDAVQRMDVVAADLELNGGYVVSGARNDYPHSRDV